MIKRIYILSLIILLSNVVFGQFIGRDNFSKSLYYMQKQELDSAKKYIDLSMVEESLRNQAKTLYYKGFIYKELYKNREKSNRTSPYRLTAVKSFEKVLKVDTTHEFTESAAKILKYLSQTIYNDVARSLNPKTIETAQKNYKLFRKITLLINPSINMEGQDVKFKLAQASMWSKSVEGQTPIDSNVYYKITTLYVEILEIDANNAGANYNLATLYYNQAVDIINDMDYDMDIEKLNEVQDKCYEYFFKALPYMHKSYDLKFRLPETLKGLGTIYHGLNDEEKEKKYNDELLLLEEQNNK